MMTTSNEHNNAPAVPQDRIDKAKRAVKDLADEAQANGNSEAWVSAQERLILSVIDAATPAPAPAQEVATLSLAAEDVHAAFAKNFPKSRISQAWINFAADIAQAIAARAAKPAQGEPFGYFRAEPFGWADCSEDAEGAIALYEHPAKPAQEVDEAQLQKLRENGAKAWAGVDANALRAGYEPAQEVGLTDGEPAHGAGLLEQRRELDAIEFFESTNRDSCEFKKSVRGIYANPAVARDWKWFQLGMKHATEDES